MSLVVIFANIVQNVMKYHYLNQCFLISRYSIILVWRMTINVIKWIFSEDLNTPCSLLCDPWQGWRLHYFIRYPRHRFIKELPQFSIHVLIYATTELLDLLLTGREITYMKYLLQKNYFPCQMSTKEVELCNFFNCHTVHYQGVIRLIITDYHELVVCNIGEKSQGFNLLLNLMKGCR